MPSDIEKLYDAIYSTIPHRLLSELWYICYFSSLALRVPYTGRSFFLADECRFMNLDPEQITPEFLASARQTFDRRLTARATRHLRSRVH